MRRLLTGLVVAATTVVVPTLALADNQKTADQIAKNLRDSGQLHGYKIGVKVQDGTAWLKGRVQSQAQMNAALKLVFKTSGVTRVINELQVASAEPAASAAKPKAAAPKPVLAASKPTGPSHLSTSMTLRIDDAKSTPVAVSSHRAQASRKLAAARQAEWASTAEEKQEKPRTLVQSATSNRSLARRVANSFATGLVQPAAALEPLMIPRHAVATAQGMRIPGRPIPIAYTQPGGSMPAAPGRPMPAYVSGQGGGVAPARYDQPHMPNHAWPSYAAYPNYAGLTYPRQYSPTAWPYIGPFYPYPQVPLGWRKVTLEWDDGWWMLDFKGR